MPKIKFSKANREDLEVENGETLMQALTSRGVPVASSCSGKLVCAKCYIQVTDGSYNLSMPDQEERDFMEVKGIDKNCRMACACKVEGDITIDTPYW